MDFPKSVPGVGLVGGQFVDENPSIGQQGSLIPSAWGNAVTHEILGVIEAAGYAPAEEDHSQLTAAIRQLIQEALPRGAGYESVYLTKAYGALPAFVKTSADTISIKAGTAVYIPSFGHVVSDADTPVIMPAVLSTGDYSIWASAEGAAQAVRDTLPDIASAPAPGAVKIGGFHYGPVMPGTTLTSGGFNTATRASDDFKWTQQALDLIVGINAHSIWDLQWRPKCDPRGMVCVTAENGLPLFWVDIYFCGTNHLIDGTSKHGSNVASGTVLPQRAPKRGGGTYADLSWFVAAEIAFDHGKRLMSYQEFAEMAYGVTEAQSLGGASSTIPATAFQAGYTSRFGVPQATGHHWVYGNIAHADSGTAWAVGALRGQTYGMPVRAIFGGARDGAAYSGSRCSDWGDSAWDSHWSAGLRAACDHLILQ